MKMLSFTHYLNEEKNLHMEHVDDLIFNKGIAGAREAFFFLSSIRDMLAGKTKSQVSATVKWDGAPSIFAGIDPADGKFFVAKKGLFNVKPKMYKTQEDIKNDLEGDLAAKFSIALEEFAKLGIKSGIYQGDLMFTKGDLKTEVIDGEKFITFQPNTIVYAVPFVSGVASRLRAAKIGVVWHTTYTGKTLSSMKASFGKGIVDKLNNIPSVWMDDATYRDVSGSATMTEKETSQVTALLSSAGSLLRTIPSAVLNAIATDEELQIRVKTYNNSKIRAGQGITSTRNHVKGLIDFIEAYYNKQIASVKTAAAKSKYTTIKKQKVGVIANHFSDLVRVYEFYNILVQAKTILVRKMNQAESLGTFLRTPNGFKVTTPEGYVAIDHLKGGAVKFVDRLEFSRANFSADFVKGWQR